MIAEYENKKVFVVPAEIFAQLDPIEKIVIRAQERRGEVKILELVI